MSAHMTYLWPIRPRWKGTVSSGFLSLSHALALALPSGIPVATAAPVSIACLQHLEMLYWTLKVTIYPENLRKGRRKWMTWAMVTCALSFRKSTFADALSAKDLACMIREGINTAADKAALFVGYVSQSKRSYPLQWWWLRLCTPPVYASWFQLLAKREQVILLISEPSP